MHQYLFQAMILVAEKLCELMNLKLFLTHEKESPNYR